MRESAARRVQPGVQRLEVGQEVGVGFDFVAEPGRLLAGQHADADNGLFLRRIAVEHRDRVRITHAGSLDRNADQSARLVEGGMHAFAARLRVCPEPAGIVQCIGRPLRGLGQHREDGPLQSLGAIFFDDRPGTAVDDGNQ